MAATVLTVRQIKRSIDGTTSGSPNDSVDTPIVFFSDLDTVDGNVFVNVPNQTFVWIKNLHVSADIVVNIPTTYTREGYALADLQETISAGDEALLGPFSAIFHNSSGEVALTYTGDGAADGKICVCRLG